MAKTFDGSSGYTFDNDPGTFDGIDPDIWSAGGIASAEAFGSGQLNHYLIAPGIVSQEAFGSHNVIPPIWVLPTGVSSEEAFGTASVNLKVYDFGIGTEEGFGTPWVRHRWDVPNSLEGDWSADSGKTSTWNKAAAGDTSWA